MAGPSARMESRATMVAFDTTASPDKVRLPLRMGASAPRASPQMLMTITSRFRVEVAPSYLQYPEVRDVSRLERVRASVGDERCCTNEVLVTRFVGMSRALSYCQGMHFCVPSTHPHCTSLAPASDINRGLLSILPASITTERSWRE